MKIIHINPLTPENLDQTNGDDYFKSDEIYGGWATPLIRNIINKGTNFEFEHWKMYDSDLLGDKGIIIKEKYDIVFRFFPSRKYYSFTSLGYISKDLIASVRKVQVDEKRLLIHIQSQPHTLFSLLIALCCKNIPLVAFQGGPRGPPWFRFRFSKNPYFLFLHIIDSIACKDYYDMIIAGSSWEYNYIRKVYGNERSIIARRKGFDFDLDKNLDKQTLRKELNISLNKKVLLYVGSLNSTKGLPQILDSFEKFDSKTYELLIISGDKAKGALYQRVINSEAIYLGKQQNSTVIKYMAASDLLISICTDPEWKSFAGFGSAQVESLSVGTPVLTTQLKHFPGPAKYLNYLGKLPTNLNDITNDIKTILKNKKRYSLSKKISQKYFSWDLVIDIHKKCYNKLFDKYYGKIKTE